MRKKKILGIVLLVIGILLFGASLYIEAQVAEGKEQISSAQGTVDKGKALFSLDPLSQQVGKTITNPIQKKINEGQEEVLYYERLALWLKLAGIICFVTGVAVLVWKKK